MTQSTELKIVDAYSTWDFIHRTRLNWNNIADHPHTHDFGDENKDTMNCDQTKESQQKLPV